ncbi:MAG: DUF1641 domain-containing protein [bacterium]|nr:DUF1641 domain-containing protein [bacterium]
MENKSLPTERMAVQINEIYDRLNTIESLIADLAPALEKITRETQPVAKELRERFERDETLTLIKKIGENIPTFVKLLDIMATTKGLVSDLYPAIEKISKEIAPSIKMLRESFEKDETLQLIQKTGENMGIFNKLLNFLAGFDTPEMDTLFGKETQSMIKGIERCTAKAMQQLAKEPLKHGFRQLISAIRDPEVQKGLLFLLMFAKNMPECISETIKENRLILDEIAQGH